VKHFRSLIVLAACILLFIIYARFRTTSITINAKFSDVEQRLFSALNINKEELLNKPYPQSKVEEELRKSLTMGIHNLKLLQYSPNERLIFVGEHKYNIMASGLERYKFDLKRVNDTRTRVRVDYFENSNLGGFIPITYDPGGNEENHLLKVIFDGM